MEIEVGEYIRTISGDIYKYDETNQYILDCDLFYNRIVKHSKNIIDLIEVGDYVNGYKVELSRYNELYYAYVYCGGIGVRTIEPYATFIKDMKNEDIESVVTKELFEQHSYKL